MRSFSANVQHGALPPPRARGRISRSDRVRGSRSRHDDLPASCRRCWGAGARRPSRRPSRSGGGEGDQGGSVRRDGRAAGAKLAGADPSAAVGPNRAAWRPTWPRRAVERAARIALRPIGANRDQMESARAAAHRLGKCPARALRQACAQNRADRSGKDDDAERARRRPGGLPTPTP